MSVLGYERDEREAALEVEKVHLGVEPGCHAQKVNMMKLNTGEAKIHANYCGSRSKIQYYSHVTRAKQLKQDKQEWILEQQMNGLLPWKLMEKSKSAAMPSNQNNMLRGRHAIVFADHRGCELHTRDAMVVPSWPTGRPTDHPLLW